MKTAGTVGGRAVVFIEDAEAALRAKDLEMDVHRENLFRLHQQHKARASQRALSEAIEHVERQYACRRPRYEPS